MKLHTPDLTAANIDRIAALFPNCVTEAKDEKGKLKRAIDFDLLKQELSPDLVEGPQERYRLDWPGKREALALANQPVALTLRPCRDESVDFETTQNLYIEGDNLDALKLLQETYLGKVKMIYIDPPYNTGNDFIYDDNFSMGRGDYEELSGDRDDEGNAMFDAEKWKQNSSANGRFHSEWLSMIYPRLKLARNLLREDGVLFMSIDDGEVSNLKRLSDEVFGENNFTGSICWQKRYVSNVTAKWLSDMHDHILVYSRTCDQLSFRDWDRTAEQEEAYKNPDNDHRGRWRSQDLSASKPYAAGLFEITGPTGNKFLPPPGRYWRCNERQFNEWRDDNRIWWGINSDARPMLKSFLEESTRGIKPHTWWAHDFAGHNKEATLEVKELFDGSAPFDTAKPVKLLGKLLQLLHENDSIVLDFFSGSATTAHAVMQLNAEDGGKRRHIMVQLPEPCAEKSEAFKAGYKTIAEIGKERIRRAGKKILEEWQAKQAKENSTQGDLLHPPSTISDPLSPPDIGFRVLKIDSSNFRDIERTPDDLDQQELALHTEHIKPDRTPEDLLFQVLVDWGVDLALPIVSETLHGKRVFFVDDSTEPTSRPALAACFDTGLTDELIQEIAARKPLRAVFRDDGFGDDSTRINVEQIFRLLSPGTEIKSL